LAGIRNAVKNGDIQDGDVVMAISTATGLKFTESAAGHLQHEIIEAKDCKTDTVAKIMDL